MIRVEHGDCLEVIPQLVAEGVLVDAIVTDPPYHLSEPPHVASGGFGGSRSDERRAARAGFMGQRWDGGDIAFRPETWDAIGAALKPGGYLLAFGGSRTHHRIWSAIEDAGFVIQDTIMWVYGSGFPKGRTQLKPAHEPICVAYKPGGKRALNIDECRIPGATPSIHRRETARQTGNAPGRPREYGHTITNRITPEAYMADRPGELLGRWPANLCHDGSDEVMEVFAAFGARSSGSAAFPGPKGTGNGVTYAAIKPQGPIYGDTGSASRFYYCAKANKADRAGSRHPTVKPVALMRWLVRLVTPPDGTLLDPFAGSGTTAAAAVAEGRNAILIEREDEYIGDIRRRLAISRGEGRHSMVAKHRDRQEMRGTLL